MDEKIHSIEKLLFVLLKRHTAFNGQFSIGVHRRFCGREFAPSGDKPRCLRRYAPVPRVQTAADRSEDPSRGRQRSGLSEYKAWRSPPFGHIGGIRKAQAFLPALSMKSFSYFGTEPVRITGTCLTFFPMVRRSSAKTISGVRSK